MRPGPRTSASFDRSSPLASPASGKSVIAKVGPPLRALITVDNLFRSLAFRHFPRLDDRARPFLRPLLRQVVSGACEDAMLVRAGEFLRVMGRGRNYAVRVPIDRDGWNGDLRLSREAHFNLIIPRIARAGREAVAMPVGMDDDSDEVGVVEGARRSVEGRIVERPVRRPHAPTEARDLPPVLLEATPSPLVVEVILVPERRLFGWTRRLHGMRDVLDVVRIAGNERDDPVR